MRKLVTALCVTVALTAAAVPVLAHHSLAAELGPYGVRSNAVLPGPVRGERFDRVVAERAAAEGKSIEETERWYLKEMPLGRVVTPEEVATAVTFLASDDATSITGQALNVDGGFRMQ